MSDPGGLPDKTRGTRRRRASAVLASILALAAALLAGAWLLRPIPGASSWTGKSLCGPVGAGSTDDGVEEPFPKNSAGETISLDFQKVTFYGRFHGTLVGGRFAAGVPVSGWLRARGFTATYRTPAGARGEIRGTIAGNSLKGRCTEKFTESLDGGRQGLTIGFTFRLAPCDK